MTTTCPAVEQLRALVAWLYVSAPSATADETKEKFETADPLIAAVKEKRAMSDVEIQAITAAIEGALKIMITRTVADPILAAMLISGIGK